ncbi:MAG: type II toxin-antitoxin system RelB/DinJ family antitoxin [Aerococcus sp.]|nr:type II toxin-antitoxin system RelB/DinJ family antitoxin [Aerococcus sp.]
MAKTTITIQIDTRLKKRTQKIFKEIGMDFNTGINIYLHKVVQYGGIPFELTANDRSSEVIDEAENVESTDAS